MGVDLLLEFDFAFFLRDVFKSLVGLLQGCKSVLLAEFGDVAGVTDSGRVRGHRGFSSSCLQLVQPRDRSLLLASCMEPRHRELGLKARDAHAGLHGSPPC